MRNMFNIQYELGFQPIEEVQIPIDSRDELPPTLLALQYIYKTPELNEKVCKINKHQDSQGQKTNRQKWHVRMGNSCTGHGAHGA